MTKKNNMQYIKAKREAFIKLYVEAKIRWISKSIHPTFEEPHKNPSPTLQKLPSQEELSTLYEKVDARNYDDSK